MRFPFSSASALRGASSLAIILSLGMASQAAAQAQGATEKAHSVDELIVTGSYTTNAKLDSATGLGLSIRETPQSVTVMTAQRMEDQNIRTLSDVINNAAGVSSKNLDSSRNGFSARGFSIEDYQIDGVPVQWDSGFSAGESLIDVALYERVEIVRGATGLLTGAGYPSASINLIRKHADSREPTGSFTASVGRWNAYHLMGDVSAPLTFDGAVRGRAVAQYEEADSFVDGLHDQKLVLYGVFDVDLAPETKLSFGASYQDNQPSGTTWGGLPVWRSDGSRTNWPRSKTIGADWTSWASTNETYFANLEQGFGGDWTLTLNASFTRNKSDSRLLYLYGQTDRVTGLGLGSFPSRYEGELAQADVGARLTGSYELMGREHELIVGASYAKRDFEFFSYQPDVFTDPGDFNNWDSSFPQPNWIDRAKDVDEKTTQKGLFAATRLSLSDPLKVILGGRFASWEREGVAYGGSSDYGDDAFLPYAGVLYDIAADHTIYASYTKIFQPQSFQDKTGAYLPPLTGVNYEAGLKSSFFDGALNTAASVFRIEQENLGQRDIGQVIPGTVFQAYYAAKGVESVGFEVEANGEVLPGLAVSVNYTQFDAKDAAGDRVNTLFAQKLLRLFTTYNFSGPLDGLTIGGGVNWEDESYTDTVNPVTGLDERLKVESHALVNLMARYQINDRFSAQLNVENLFDKTYYSQIGFYDQLAYGEPRNVTLTLQYRY